MSTASKKWANVYGRRKTDLDSGTNVVSWKEAREELLFLGDPEVEVIQTSTALQSKIDRIESLLPDIR